MFKPAISRFRFKVAWAAFWLRTGIQAETACALASSSPTAALRMLIIRFQLYSNGFLGAGVLEGAGGFALRAFTSCGVTSSPELPNEL